MNLEAMLKAAAVLSALREQWDEESDVADGNERDNVDDLLGEDTPLGDLLHKQAKAEMDAIAVQLVIDVLVQSGLDELEKRINRAADRFISMQDDDVLDDTNLEKKVRIVAKGILGGIDEYNDRGRTPVRGGL